jgi:hypothetical protein
VSIDQKLMVVARDEGASRFAVSRAALVHKQHHRATKSNSFKLNVLLQILFLSEHVRAYGICSERQSCGPDTAPFDAAV